MTLINRVSAFFLLALGVCLFGYSAAMYLLIREHLFHQFDNQLINSLNVLVAAVEVESDGVKWQPSDHTITLGNEREEEEVRWAILNELKETVDVSRNLTTPTEIDAPLLALAQTIPTVAVTTIRDIHNWRYLQQKLVCPDPKPASERDADESAELTITVALDAERLHADLLRLGILATSLPCILWTIAALAGRAYCRRALQPVGSMVAKARSMTNVDFDLRLPVSTQDDELSSLAEAFNSLLDRLQQAYQQQQRFTGDAAHQLRTPLTILRGQIDVALRRPRDAAAYREVLTLLSDQTSELQQIVETLLFLARTEGDTHLPDECRLHLRSWMQHYMEQWQTHPRATDLQVEIDSDAAVTVSESLLRQAIDNLISNALKYSPANSPVTLRVSQSGGIVQLAVEDQGAGIAVEEREEIFSPFYRSRSAREAGVTGTGLGLAIVARIAQALKGSVRCEPNTPLGSRFLLTLPGEAVVQTEMIPAEHMR